MEFSKDSFDLEDQIHKDALRVLEETGVKCASSQIRSLFEETGLAAFDESTGHLHVLSPLVEQALATAPKRGDFWIPENSFGVGGTAPFVYDETIGDLIAPTFEHVKKIATVADQADEVAFMARGVLMPKQEVKVMDTIIEHCKKSIYVAALSEEGLERAREIHQKRGGIVVQFSIINSPLNIIESMIPAFFSCARKGIPVYVSTMPMAGLSAPYSMSALVTLTHAEALFGITLTQLIKPGLMTIHAGLPSIANIRKNYAVDLGLIEHNLANILMDRVGAYLDIPCIQTACTTSEEAPGPRAEQDGKMGFALCRKYGFHQMRHSFGFLKELVSFSIKKLERHIELCRDSNPADAPEHFFPGYDEEGLEAIMRNSSNANYMRDEHTLKNTGKNFLR